MTLIYNAAIRPAITYAAEIWAVKLTLKQRNKINNIQSGINRYNECLQNNFNTCTTSNRQLVSIRFIYRHAKKYKTECRNFNKKEMKKQEERKLKEMWNKRWKESDTGRLTFKFIPDIETRNKIKISYERHFIEFITGHGKTNAYLFNIGKAEL